MILSISADALWSLVNDCDCILVAAAAELRSQQVRKQSVRAAAEGRGRSEAELGEEPLRLPRLVPLLELSLHLDNGE